MSSNAPHLNGLGMVCSWPVQDSPSGDGSRVVLAYGQQWPPMTDAAIELSAWRQKLSVEAGGLGPYEHLRNAHHLIWPSQIITYHEWTRDRFSAFCEGHTIVTLAGGGGIGKSADVAKYILMWWWANPQKRAVIVASTTLNMLMQRIWGYISKYRHMDNARQMPGVMSVSKPPKMVFSKEDTMHGVFGFALKEGKTEKTLSDVIGIHPDEGLLVVVDEATDVTPAIEEAITNWKSGGTSDDYFHMIVMGNSKSRLDPHGRLSRPLRGWSSINPDVDTRWETENGVCLYFDCYKSPAILHPENPRLGFLWTAKKIEDEVRRLGKDHPNFHRFVRGIWPPESLEKTVLTPTLIDKHNAQGKAEFSGMWKIRLAGLDPAFTSEGDNCVLRFADLGIDTRGYMVLQYDKDIEYLRISATSKEPVTYQVVRLAKEACEARGILPEHLAVDTWGFGMGAGDIFHRLWSDKVYRVVSIGSPSGMAVDSDMARDSTQMFDRRVTELWWMMREAVMSSQIFGLDDRTVEQFCTRMYEWKGQRIRLESKPDYKKRMGREQDSEGSPDEADAACLILDLARSLGFKTAPRGGDEAVVVDWEQAWNPSMGNPESGGDSGDEMELSVAAFEHPQEDDDDAFAGID